MTQAGQDLLTGRVMPYELSKADLGGEGSMTALKQALLRTTHSEERTMLGTGEYVLP